jgi:hypothetical protein
MQSHAMTPLQKLINIKNAIFSKHSTLQVPKSTQNSRNFAADFVSKGENRPYTLLYILEETFICQYNV